MIEITGIMSELSRERPVFHSEADFRHALAWKIKERHLGLGIRLEVPMVLDKKDKHIDILVLEDRPIMIEVKYRTRCLHAFLGNEEFFLKDHSAIDAGRYEFVKDISRLEKALDDHPNNFGMAIFLTNDKSFWQKPTNDRITADHQFKIHEGRTLEGRLEWRSGMASEEEPITLKGNYSVSWKDYSDLRMLNGAFRYSVVEVSPP